MRAPAILLVAAGLLPVAPASGAAQKGLLERVDAAIDSGSEWLGVHFAVDRNPGHGRWHFYYLYGLERAGILCDVEKMGTHSWYPEGAAYLVRRQNASGSWDARGARRGDAGITDTCFALLFLKRGTVPVRLPAVTPR
jgi:hypothetical protein